MSRILCAVAAIEWLAIAVGVILAPGCDCRSAFIFLSLSLSALAAMLWYSMKQEEKNK